MGRIDEFKNHVCDPEYTSTRDNSLRCVIEVLVADDVVFPDNTHVAMAEKKIRETISAKLGDGTWEVLEIIINLKVLSSEIGNKRV